MKLHYHKITLLQNNEIKAIYENIPAFTGDDAYLSLKNSQTLPRHDTKMVESTGEIIINKPPEKESAAVEGDQSPNKEG